MPRTMSALTLLTRLAVASALIGVSLGFAFGWAVGGPRGGLLALAGTTVVYGGLLALVIRVLRTLAEGQRAVQEAFDGTIRSLAVAIDTKDAYSADHTARVCHYAQAIAHAHRLPADDVQAIRLASYLRNLGKIGIPERVLLKSAALDEQEWATVRRHARIAHRILAPAAIDARVKAAVRHGHERWDGSGYPDGLAGEAIPIHARILLVAEAYLAMSTDRPYRKAKGTSEAIKELQRGAGTQFDPRIVEVFLTVLEQEDLKAWALGPVLGGTELPA